MIGFDEIKGKDWGIKRTPGKCSKCGEVWKGKTYFCPACSKVAIEVSMAVVKVVGIEAWEKVLRNFCTETVSLEK